MEEYTKFELSRSQIEKAGKFFSKCLEENDDYVIFRFCVPRYHDKLELTEMPSIIWLHPT